MNATARRAAPTPSPDPYKRLHAADAGPSEWYMYFYLKYLAEVAGTPTVRTSLNSLKVGTADAEPIRLAHNTIRSSISNLEDAGLISVERTPQGVAVFLTIQFL
jgi:hypothetical protein